MTSTRPWLHAGFSGIALLFAGGCGPSPSPSSSLSLASDAPSSADAAIACEDGDPTHERYGTDCLCCHRGDFSAAGSVAQDSGVARIVVRDSVGNVLDMTPNPYGNFFRHLPITPPLRVTVFDVADASIAMQADAPSGACNSCHRPGGAAPRIFGPSVTR